MSISILLAALVWLPADQLELAAPTPTPTPAAERATDGAAGDWRVLIPGGVLKTRRDPR